jgi:hypothetical protein
MLKTIKNSLYLSYSLLYGEKTSMYQVTAKEGKEKKKKQIGI